jgi:pimeloyl-ACP methyl ester carboxylesterase
LRLNHHRAGEGEPLVLVHGVGATWRVWLPVIGALAARHEVVAVDLPGFGESPPLPHDVPATAASLADAVENQLGELNLATVHLAGNSVGGSIAIELARRGRARSVVAIAPVGLGTDHENRATRRRLGLVSTLAPTLDRVAGPMSRTALGRSLLYGLSAARPWRVEPSEIVLSVRAFVRSSGSKQMLDWFLDNPPDALEAIRCPVTIAWGTRDRLVSFRQAERFAARIPHAQVHLLDRLGHVPMSDDPDLLAATILGTTDPTAGVGEIAAEARL